MSNSTQPSTKKRRGPPVRDIESSDEALKLRRQKNRGAQHVFRKRRQAAELAQGLRIKALEEVVEDMSSVFINLFDEILGTEELAKQHPGLVGSLRSSAARILTSVKAVTSANGDYLTQGQHRWSRERRSMSNMDLPMEPFGNLYAEMSNPVSLGMNVDLDTTTSPYQLSSQTQQILSALDSFSLRLLETTLSQAYHFLNGTLPVPPDDLNRPFGSTLRFRTRTQLLTRIRWLLGPGRSHMRQAAGISWSTGQGSASLCFENSASVSVSSDPDGASLLSTDHRAPPGFLTALGVQEQLRDLGGRMLNLDTMEIVLGSSPSSTINIINFGGLQSTNPETSMPLAMQLSVSLLTTNLAHTAVCLVSGPVYPLSRVVGAMEASLTLVR
ncbi:hypothetical protein QQX98_005025 [Neonectria punicea]|uniref:BZIP domain-containing protein n=1 Tax=Neonectria punicea TaxID=979145 RepID=A0ABR1H6N0_9HYPO